MKIAFLIARAAIQSVFAQLVLLLYVVSTTLSLPTTVAMTTTLFVLLGLFQLFFGFLLWKRPLSVILIPLVSSFLTTLILTLYPLLGFAIDFWVLFAVLFFAGVIAHALLLNTGASWSDKNHEYTRTN